MSDQIYSDLVTSIPEELKINNALSFDAAKQLISVRLQILKNQHKAQEAIRRGSEEVLSQLCKLEQLSTQQEQELLQAKERSKELSSQLVRIRKDIKALNAIITHIP